METVSTPTVWSQDTALKEKRDVWQALKRGFRGRCPRCGEGKLFRAFLKVDNACSVCGQDFTPHRADDLPAYLVIVIVGHIVVPIGADDRNQLLAAGRAATRDLSAADLRRLAGAAATGQRRRGRDAVGAAHARI